MLMSFDFKIVQFIIFYQVVNYESLKIETRNNALQTITYLFEKSANIIPSKEIYPIRENIYFHLVFLPIIIFNFLIFFSVYNMVTLSAGRSYEQQGNT